MRRKLAMITALIIGVLLALAAILFAVIRMV
jgi:hypothetical protein